MDNNYQSPNIDPNHNVSWLNWIAILLTIMANISQIVELGLDIAPYIKQCPRLPMEVLEHKIPE